VNHTKILKYQQEIWHNGLNERKVITDPYVVILNNKVKTQIDDWNLKWDAICQTKEAEKKLLEAENILLDTLNKNHAIDFDKLKDNKKFEDQELNLSYPKKPIEPKLDIYPVAPEKSWPKFQPKKTFFTTKFKYFRNREINKKEDYFNTEYSAWEKQKNDTIILNNKLSQDYTKSILEFNEKVIKWEANKAEYLEKQKIFNAKVDAKKSQYLSLNVSVVIEYCKMVLNISLLPSYINKKFDIDYNKNNKILIIDYLLPNIEDLPNLKEVKYLSSKNEIKEIYQNDAFMANLFDSTIYKLILRVLYEEFTADVANAIAAISFNGWVNYLNKATGKREDACIATIQVKKEAFVSVDLKNVDPKTCFKSLKGVASSKLAGITPVRPILTMNKDDKRFVASHDVTNKFDDSTNIAAIPWEEFEHLIREVFEAEFSTNGGDVKVTQASRDGGVDAIAFDPDPIRGGKIVIQAKRYTNTVGVSAVRDLYGTVVNEGATKGILVTTADYGPDAYAFAENKPLTLLNGGNLLHLLEKQGHKAKIDLREAKALNLANGN